MTDGEKKNPTTVLLIVDDDPVNILLLRTILINIFPEAEIITAKNGLIAVEIFKERKNKIYCIFMDIHMPVMNGYEATIKIRSIEAKEPGIKRTPILVVTACHAISEKKIVEAGIDDAITKPITKNSLKAFIEKNIRQNSRLSIPKTDKNVN